MHKFSKFLIVSSFLVLVLHNVVIACWNGFEHDKYNYRFWLFQPDLMPQKSLQVLSYTAFESDFNDYDYHGSFRFRGNTDTSFYDQNIAEWQIALAADPSVKSPKTVVGKDIHTILYNLDPEDYFRKMAGDSLHNNTFIRAIGNAQSLMNYVNFAKVCEQLMNFMDPWVPYSEGKDDKALLKYMKIGESVLQQKTVTPFVKERTAFQMIKMAHYLNDTARVFQLYRSFFEKTTSKSWVVGSASFYYAVAHEDLFVQNYLLSRTFENSIDKRWLALRRSDFSDSILRGALTHARNTHERAVLLTLPILLGEGRELTNLKKVYDTEPQNALLQTAIQREINKLEDWIYTNKFTEYNTSSKAVNTEDYYDDVEKKHRADAQNLRADLLYFDEVRAFVNRVVQERQQPNLAFWQLAAGHLAFLKKDFATAKQYLAAAKLEKTSADGHPPPLSIKTQIWLTDLLCDLYQTEHIGTEAETAILAFDDFLRQQKNTLKGYTTFRSQIMRFLSDRFIADGKVAQGMLILSKSTLTFGAIRDHWEKNFYHKLLEMGTPQYFEDVIDIVSRKQRTALTPFEQWLASEPKPYAAPYGCRYCSEEEKRDLARPKWDVSKLKDYESIIYVNQDKLDSAYAVLQTVPEQFWRTYPYAEYMTEDPFTPALDYRARSAVSYDDNWENPTTPRAKYTKPQFLKRLITLKNDLASDPVKYEKNYFLIGTAYFNMTHYGKFWLMSQIFWDGLEVEKRTEFNTHFYGCQRAAIWFAEGVARCKDEKLAAMCCFSANLCQQNKDMYEYELKYSGNYDNRPDVKITETPLWRDLRNRFRGAKQYEETDYWCTNLANLVEMYKY